MDKIEEQRLINEALYGLIEVFQEIDIEKKSRINKSKLKYIFL
jgi:hypothetical protein